MTFEVLLQSVLNTLALKKIAVDTVTNIVIDISTLSMELFNDSARVIQQILKSKVYRAGMR